MPGGRKILLYVHALTGGGAERVWTLLASGLAAMGFDVILATDFAAQENISYLNPEVRHIVLGGNHLKHIWRLSQLMRREQPDIVMSALCASNLKMVIAAIGAGMVRRSIISYHGYTDTEPQVLSRIGYAATPLLTRLSGATVCVSDGLRDYVVSTWHGSASRCQRIYNPVVIAGTPAHASDDLAARAPIVLASGRLVSYKNFASLIRAFAEVKPAEAQLRILGAGPERQALKAEIHRLGLERRVALLGYHPQPWSQYEQARCFVLPSSKEPFGLVIVEALAHGLPVVATACDGPLEILSEGIGTLVMPGDETGLADAISAALAAPGDPEPRQIHAAQYSLDAALEAYTTLFDRVTRRDQARNAGPVVTITHG
jgi:glycosyltransferase involved in cell wall biosynthesis